MPYAFENRKLRLPESLDRRRMVTPDQRQRMFQLRSTGMSYKRIAEAVGLSKSTTMWVLSPRFRERIHEYAKRNWRRFYEAHKSERDGVVAEHRHYKHKLMQE